jgi:hypothetical protein
VDAVANDVPIDHVHFHHQRSLLSVEKTIENENSDIVEMTSRRNCVAPDIEQFPHGFFNQQNRRHGAVLVHLFIVMYMFIGLALICDDYFVPSLECICKRLHLTEDVAGQVFLIIINFVL